MKIKFVKDVATFTDGNFSYPLKYFMSFLEKVSKLGVITGFPKYLNVIWYLTKKDVLEWGCSNHCGYIIKQNKLKLFIEEVENLKVPKHKKVG